jgi:hypothetical protein
MSPPPIEGILGTPGMLGRPPPGAAPCDLIIAQIASRSGRLRSRLRMVPTTLQPIAIHPILALRTSSSMRKMIPIGRPAQGIINPSAAAALGARPGLTPKSVRGVFQLGGGATPGVFPARAGGAPIVAPAGAPTLSGRRGRPHCQQVGDVGKLFPPQ